MRILVCGSRSWTDSIMIRRELQQLPRDTVLIHGDNGYDSDGRPLWGQDDRLAVRGADKLAGAIAVELGFQVVRFTPDWERHGRRAGPLRNSQMLVEGKPETVLAFTSDLERSAGTKDMVRQAQAAGIPVKVVGPSRKD